MIYFLVGLGALLAVLGIAWRVMIWMPGRPFRGEALPLDDHATQVRDRLLSDLTVLAEQIGERNVSARYWRLVESAEFIERSLEDAGYRARRQEFAVDGKNVWNVDAELTGNGNAEEIIVVGAHYDTVPGSPGANDNGSAVVANLALARALADVSLRRTVRFAFFVNEEWPYYMTGAMGSLRYAQACQANADNVVGMISLETIGCYLNTPDSQRYPVRLLKYLYPTTGNFLAVVGNVRSRRWVHQVVRGLRRAPFPTQGMAAPRWLKDIFRSDHAAFWHCGFPALMITDTANFRYRHYHTPEDTVDKINFDALARVVTALEKCLAELAGG